MSDGPVEYETVASAAQRWDTSPDFIRAQIKANKLPAYRSGSKLIRVRMADVDAMFPMMNEEAVARRQAAQREKEERDE